MKIAIITNVSKDIGLVTAMKAAELLSGRAELYMSRECVLPGNYNITYLPYEALWSEAEAVLVIGGDGTLLRVAARCAQNNIPALGINLGKVGFLTEVEPDDMASAAKKLLSGEYITEKRMLLKISVNGETAGYHALNDVVVSKPEGMKLISLDLFTDGELVNHYVGDGLIIATPTGSTGYSISAGGPVVDPGMSLYIATPICAHMLSVRSAILSAEKEITLRLGSDYANTSAIITTDGERQRFISADDEITITKSDYKFELIRIGRSSFYNTLISKLS
ncbi:MAG: NAD(+)/NADH kinase [Clostridiales bacterium]|nr:NAD(+)/NADH kinase [Clostridiales bacterium]